MITLESINRAEALRYLGRRSTMEITPQIDALMNGCEQELLSAVRARFIYKAVKLPCEEIISGEDIVSHLKNCEMAVLLCATLGSEVDSLIRRSSVDKMDRAVVLNALASAAIEKVCDIAEAEIKERFKEYFMTYRFSCGYGDYPIDMQSVFLRILDAQKKIGVCTTQSSTLEPMKSVTAVIGLSRTQPEKRRRSCAVCNMRTTCKFRKEGLRCAL